MGQRLSCLLYYTVYFRKIDNAVKKEGTSTHLAGKILVVHLNTSEDIHHPVTPDWWFPDLATDTCFVLFSQTLSEKLEQKERDYLQLEEMLAMEKGTKKKVQDGLREREQEVQELQSQVTVAEDSLQKAQVDLQERTEEVSKLKTEMGELEVKHAELKVERKQLEQLREEKESHGAQQQTEIGQVSHPQFHDCEWQCV